MVKGVPDKISKQRKLYQKQSKVDVATSKVGRGVTKLKVGKYVDRPVKHNLGGLWERYLHSVGETNQYQKDLNKDVLSFLDKDNLSTDEKKALKSAKGFKKSLFERAVKGKQPMHDITVMSMGTSQYPAEMVRQVYDKLSPDVQRLKVDRLRARKYMPPIEDVQQAVETVFAQETRNLKTVVEKQKADLKVLKAKLEEIADKEKPKLEHLQNEADAAQKRFKDAEAMRSALAGDIRERATKAQEAAGKAADDVAAKEAAKEAVAAAGDAFDRVASWAREVAKERGADKDVSDVLDAKVQQVAVDRKAAIAAQDGIATASDPNVVAKAVAEKALQAVDQAEKEANSEVEKLQKLNEAAQTGLTEAKSAMPDPKKIDTLNADLDTQLQTQLAALDRLKDAYSESVARSNLRTKYRTQWLGGKPIAMSDNQVENVIADKTTAIRMRSNARLGIYSASVICKREGDKIDVTKSHRRIFGKDFNTDDIRFIIQFSMKCGKTSIAVEGFDAETRHRIYQEAFKAGLNVEMADSDKLKSKNRKLLSDYDKVRQRYKDKTLSPDKEGVINQNKRMQDPGDQLQSEAKAQSKPVTPDAVVDGTTARLVAGSAL